MAEIYIRDGSGKSVVGTDNPLPVRVQDPPFIVAPTVRQMLERGIDIASWFTAEGRAFYACDGDQNDTVTGQTSFADTTPTFTLRIPAGTVAVPLLVALGQTGTVAGDAISVLMEFAGVDRYASGGTSENVRNGKVGATGNITNACTLYTGATITATGAPLPLGHTPWRITVAQDVAPAEGISNELIWSPTGPDFLEGPASVNVWTYAGTTGPTWFWTLKWLEIPQDRMGF